MVLILKNKTNNPITYSSGPITVPANGQLIVGSQFFYAISQDANLISDILAINIVVNDGIGDYDKKTGVEYLAEVGSSTQRDSDGAALSRVKQAPTGWSYQLRSFEVTTATLPNPLYNCDINGVDMGDGTVTFYDVNNNVITDPQQLVNCVKTVVDLMPTYDYYIIGGRVRMTSVPNSDVRVSVIGVPDVPYNLGGSRVFVLNVNFRFIGTTDELSADGRAAKFLQYSAQFFTNKIRFIVNHPAGAQLLVGFFVDHYKA